MKKTSKHIPVTGDDEKKETIINGEEEEKVYDFLQRHLC